MWVRFFILILFLEATLAHGEKMQEMGLRVPATSEAHSKREPWKLQELSSVFEARRTLAEVDYAGDYAPQHNVNKLTSSPPASPATRRVKRSVMQKHYAKPAASGGRKLLQN